MHFFLRSLPTRILLYQAVEKIIIVAVSGFNVVTYLFKKILPMGRFEDIFVFIFIVVVLMTLVKLFLLSGKRLFSYLSYLLETLFEMVDLVG